MSNMRTDPTAFRPMKFTASRETEVGFELEQSTKKVTLDKMRLYHPSGWPRGRSWHTDFDWARENGAEQPLVLSSQVIEYMGELLVKFFGEGYLGGKLAVSIIRPVWPDDEITTKAVVKQKVTEGDSIRLILDIWCENQHEDKVIVGTASGPVH